MDFKQDTLYAFSDGSCYPNPGPGGWGVVLIYNGHVKFVYGGAEDQTNNTMELCAIRESLRFCEGIENSVVVTDSQYCVNALTKWWPSWERNGWKTKAGTEVKNGDLIREIIPMLGTTKLVWVKGHAGNSMNEAADRLARKGRASVEEFPTEDPDLAEIKALISEDLPPKVDCIVPFDCTEEDALEEMKTLPAKAQSPITMESLRRDILASQLCGVILNEETVAEAYSRADRFLSLAKIIEEK